MSLPPAFLRQGPKAFIELPDTDPGEPLDLSTIPMPDLEAYEFRIVQPSPAIQAYMDVDDDFDQQTVNVMEETLEKHYKLPEGFSITAERVEQHGRLAVKDFTLMRES